jgi:hypothetical protein
MTGRLGALVALVGCLGCTGSRTTVVAPHAIYPVSLSRGLRDAKGELVTPDRRKVVGRFEVSRTAWNLLYSAVPLTPTTDISSEVNAQVAAARGDAIIHLTIETSQCALNYLVFPMGLLPFWPGCAGIDIHGDIVQVVP